MFLFVHIWWPLGAESVAFVAKTGAKDPFKKTQQIFIVLVKWFDDHKGEPQNSWTRQFVVALTNVKMKRCKSH